MDLLCMYVHMLLILGFTPGNPTRSSKHTSHHSLSNCISRPKFYSWSSNLLGNEIYLHSSSCSWLLGHLVSACNIADGTQ